MNKKQKYADPRSIEKIHDAKCLEAIQKVLAKESWEDPLSDSDIADALRADGLLISKGRVYDLRRQNGIFNSRERQIVGFAKAHSN